ncbi:MAG: acyl-CoA thioesterase [Ignavibacteriales bacterium]|jgi:Predicted thioesterase|nr:MAG: acyl-CoA thioesterase [Ignavibacteriaceae bacterium]MBW7872954.1 acyl-CoA thioesterase [Ignavibacteria bacterium]MCZ2142418.1 acyl-CoA thioesterase [Ignavibacteriales bacterium]MBV6445300.1 hypothetical protein [Ignavibacteriaceae bacterium]MBZ0196411.1 acyl-CoA thioesterase [Ignavibacteriaceae bacterium]
MEDCSHSVFEFTITIQPEHIDQLDHVNNLVYVKWVQDAAVNHWNKCARKELHDSIIFVIARHEIDYIYSAKLGDTVRVRTRIGAARKNLFERFTEITRESDGKLLLKALSLWCPLDAKTHRLIRPPENLINEWSVGNKNN